MSYVPKPDANGNFWVYSKRLMTKEQLEKLEAETLSTEDEVEEIIDEVDYEPGLIKGMSYKDVIPGSAASIYPLMVPHNACTECDHALIVDASPSEAEHTQFIIHCHHKHNMRLGCNCRRRHVHINNFPDWLPPRWCPKYYPDLYEVRS